MKLSRSKLTQLLFWSLLGLFIFTPQVNGASISNISPDTVIPGETIVTIYGNGFGTNSLYKNIYFGSTTAYSTSWSDTQIVVKAPSSIYKSGNLEISGSFKTGENCYGSYCYDETNYMTLSMPFYVKPVITLVVPEEAQTGDIVYIKGKYFGNSSGTVIFGTQQANIQSWSDTLISLVVPATAGNNITVKVGNATSDSYYNFEYLKSITSDTYSGHQQYLKQIEIESAWRKQSNGNPNIIVAVVDDGVYVNHNDLRSNMWVNHGDSMGDDTDNDHNGYIDDYYGYNFIDNNNDMTVKGDHGTVVAGIIGAIKNNGTGIAGIASGVKIMPVIACDDYGCPQASVINAIRYAVNMGANIINLSLGTHGTVGYSSVYDEVVKYAYDKGVLLVVAGGNGDTEGGHGQQLEQMKASPVCNEGNYNYALGVGAVDKKGTRPVWSNYGARYIDIYAPGVDIFSTSVVSFSDYDYTSTNSGTSFSAPIVAGVAALIESKFTDIKNFEVMDRIMCSGENHGGVIDADVALNTTPPDPIIIGVNSKNIKTGETITLTGKHFNSAMSIRLIGPSIDMPVSGLIFNSPGYVSFPVPSTLTDGVYSIRTSYKNRITSELNNAVSITVGTLDTGTVAQLSF